MKHRFPKISAASFTELLQGDLNSIPLTEAAPTFLSVFHL
jgi:hypothetical protein